MSTPRVEELDAPEHQEHRLIGKRPLGVSLAGLDFLIASHGGAASLSASTTSELKKAVVVPATRALRGPWVALPEATPFVGTATAFLSQ